MYNFVCRLILSQNFWYISHGFPEIIPFPVPLPLKLLERNLYTMLVLRFTVWTRYRLLVLVYFSLLHKMQRVQKTHKDISTTYIRIFRKCSLAHTKLEKVPLGTLWACEEGVLLLHKVIKYVKVNQLMIY